MGFLCWSLTRPLRTDLLRNSINRAWSQTGESRWLQAPVLPGSLPSRLSRLGTWYTTEEGRVLVFTIITDGVFLPCAAIVDASGMVEEIMPLGPRGEKTLARVSPGIIALHIRRIQGEL